MREGGRGWRNCAVTLILKLGNKTSSMYRIAEYFCGVLIFIIFVVHLGVTKFSTHKIFIFHTPCCAINTCSNLDRWRLDMPLSRYLQCPLSTGSCPACEGWGNEQRSVESRSMTKRKRAHYFSFNTEEPKVTSTANGLAQLSFSCWHSRCSSVLASQVSLWVRPTMSNPMSNKMWAKCLMLRSITRFRFRQVQKLNLLKMM